METLNVILLVVSAFIGVLGWIFAFYNQKKLQDMRVSYQFIENEQNKLIYEKEYLSKELELKKNFTQELGKELESQFKLMTSEVLEDKSKKLMELAHLNFKRG